ncbi:MAG: hypothetical protein LBR38_09950 [Synergistaceae bacterium]|jgi:hypothetical protein|nr:hypothetical protein [Synergistaceae bacterium]
MRVVSANLVVHVEGYTRHKEAGSVIRRNSVKYEHVREPVVVPRPAYEDFESLVVVHDRMEYYS